MRVKGAPTPLGRLSVSKPVDLGRGFRTVRLRLMVTGGGGHNVYPGSDPLDGGNTLLPD